MKTYKTIIAFVVTLLCITSSISTTDTLIQADKSAQYEDNHDTSQKTDSNNHSETTYILNTNTKKFHYPNCESVKHMKDKNIKYITCTRDQAISQGFSRCRLCNP